MDFFKSVRHAKKIRYFNLGNQEKLMGKAELTSCVSNLFNNMYIVRAMNEDSRRKDFIPIYIFINCAVSIEHCNNFYFLTRLQRAFAMHYEPEHKNTKIKEAFQCHYCHIFFRYVKKHKKHVSHCSGHPGFVYCFQGDNIESYENENYLKYKKDFPFTLVGDLETTTGYISAVEGGSVFATSYCLMFSFHPKLNMTPVTCLRSFGQKEKELNSLQFVKNFGSILIKLTFNVSWMRVSLFKKKKKQAISTLCMTEM